MSQHSDYRFSVTIHTDDLAVLYCLRGLSMCCQVTGNSRIPWGGTRKVEWAQQGHHVTFRFSGPDYRRDFVTQATRLLPQRLWHESGTSDHDPAIPQAGM